MRLDPFIIDLLFDHDCVIIPEFGGLVANYRSARLNIVSHVISPPAKSIGFNPSLKYNDGLLTNYISATMGITYKQAAEQLAITIAEYQQALASEGRFSIDRIGVFYKDRLGQVQFIPEEQENFLMSSYGLKPIQLKKIGRLEDEDSTKVISLNPDYSRRWKIAAAILIPALLVGSWMLGSHASKPGELGLGSYNPFSEPRKQTSFAPLENAWDLPMNFIDPNYEQLLLNQDSVGIDFVNGIEDVNGIRLKQLINSTPDEGLGSANGAKPIERKVSNVRETVSTTSNLTAAYSLIGGAFQIRENAQRFMNQLRAQGYDAQLAGMRDSLHLVAYGHFRTRSEAEQLKTRVQSSGAVAWIRTNQ
jgi:hypothetical protein